MTLCLYNTRIFILTVFFLAITSCKETKTKEEVLLSEAQLLLEEKPREALSLLDSIVNPETSLSKEMYMQYIVAYVDARYNNNIDIINDTLILKAVDYFEKHKNYEQLAVAYLYAGNLYNAREEKEKAFRFYTKSYDMAKKNHDLFTESKSIHNIGSYYFKNNLQDSAIVCFQESLKLFKQLGYKYNISQSLYSLAISNFNNQNLDEAKLYTEESISLDLEVGNTKNLSAATNSLGLIANSEENYTEALQYFAEALTYTKDSLQETKIMMNIANTYILKNRLYSAAYYINLIEERVPLTKDLYTLRSICTSLRNYYTEVSNYSKAKHYEEMRLNLKQLIDEKKITERIQAIDKERAVEQYKARGQRKYSNFFFIGFAFFTFIGALYIYYKRQSDKEIYKLKYNIMRLKNLNEIFFYDNCSKHTHH